MSIHDNMQDLMIPFQKKWYVTPSMQGSYSIRGHNRKRKLLYGRSHLSSKSSKILNVKNPRFLHSI